MLGAIQFTSDMKLGHYMKIPPRITFGGRSPSATNSTYLLTDVANPSTVQVVGATAACLASFGIKVLLFAYVPDICSPEQADQFSKPDFQ